jgi:hypothetical protein
MDVEEFVAKVLQELENGLKSATDKSQSKKFEFDKSVKFDLAVTSTVNKEASGGTKAGIGIKVVSFDVGGKGAISTGQEVVQRIQFAVYAINKNNRSGPVTSAPSNPNFLDTGY